MTSHDAFLSHSPAGQLLAMSSGPFNADAPQIKVSPAAAYCAQVLTLAHSLSPQPSAWRRQHLQFQVTQDKNNSSTTADLHTSS